jgi:hypothetical protein
VERLLTGKLLTGKLPTGTFSTDEIVEAVHITILNIAENFIARFSRQFLIWYAMLN